MIDLHTHSLYSDGSFSPRKLVALGKQAGLSAMALTDHDTTEGLDAFMDAGKEQSFETIPGVEISADNDHGTLHVLGYWFRRDDDRLQDALSRIRNGREERNRRIMEKLQTMGIQAEWSQLEALSVDGVIGRPHFAQLLQKLGVVKSKKQAFDRYLGKGKRAYVERFRLAADESLEAIKGAGGVAVLAHPSTLGLNPRRLSEFVGQLKAQGLDGIEAHYPEYTADATGVYCQIAREHGLAIAGGTDFHGDMTPDLILGRGFGNMKVADDLLDDLKSRRRGIPKGSRSRTR